MPAVIKLIVVMIIKPDTGNCYLDLSFSNIHFL